jgi:hypothetical protein
MSMDFTFDINVHEHARHRIGLMIARHSSLFTFEDALFETVGSLCRPM